MSPLHMYRHAGWGIVGVLDLFRLFLRVVMLFRIPII